MLRIIFCLTISMSILSQLPLFIESGISDYFKMLWILPATLLLPVSLKIIKEKALRQFFLFAIAFFFYCLIMDAFTDKDYIGADINNIFISLMIFVVSYAFFQRNKTKSDINWVCFSMLITSVSVAYYINSTYNLFGSLGDIVYAYDNKNSMGQILLSVVMVCGYLYKPNNRIWIAVKWISIIYLLVVIFLLKSRATIAGLFFVLLYIVFKRGSKKMRVLIAVSCVTIIGLVLMNTYLYDVIVTNILFGNRDVNDLDSLSSTRTEYYPFYINGFIQSPLIGNGCKYFDCMPLIMLYQYGILGASLVFYFLFKVYVNLKMKIKYGEKFLLSYLLFCAFLINALFEAQPPFGPGIKCFILWMMYGLTLIDYRKNNWGSKQLCGGKFE